MKVEKIRKLLHDIDERWKTDPEVPKQLEEYRRKYAVLTREDLDTPFNPPRIVKG